MNSIKLTLKKSSRVSFPLFEKKRDENKNQSRKKTDFFVWNREASTTPSFRVDSRWDTKLTPPLSEKFYQNVIAYDLILKQNLTSIMQLPRLQKIVLNTTSKIYIHEKKHLLFTLAALELISGQKPHLTFARKSIANFKVRQSQILGCRVTLRENEMYIFLDKLSKIVFPRLRDSSKKKENTFNTLKNLPEKTRGVNDSVSFGFQNVMIFPELENHYELVDHFRGMNVSFVVSNSTRQFSRLVLSGFQFPLFS